MKKVNLVLPVILLLFHFNLFAQNDIGITPIEVAKIKTVGDVKINPEGNKVAYLLSKQADPLKSNNPAEYHLYVYDLEDGYEKPFFTRKSIHNISFRPEHNSITFLTRLEEDNSTSLYEIALEGGEATKIYSYETSISDYSWSPDGNQLAFIAAVKDNDDKQKTKLPYQPEIYEENLTYNHGFVVDLQNQQEVKTINKEGHYHDIQWSPTGDKLAVAIAPTPLVDDSYMFKSIFFVDNNNLNVTGTVDHEGKFGYFEFNPDGSHLAFIGGADIHDPIDGRLLVVSSEGGEAESLRPDFEGKFESFFWLDNETIQFIASEGVLSSMGRVKSNGSGWRKILKKGEGPVLEDFDMAEDGKLVFMAELPTHPAEVYIMKDDDQLPSLLTNHNPWLESQKLGNQEIVRYKAKDGLEIEGILIKPLNYQEGQMYPLITVVHGGPESHYDHGWLTYYSTVGQMGAAMGYAVFYPNYRGSTGRGEKFAKISQIDLAGLEFDDIVDGVDYLVEQGIADENKVGVTGGSYGGYATGWLSTRYTERFAAGVMFVGISNNISKWGTSDIPEELYLVHSRKRVWEDYEFFLKRSPIYYAEESKTPLLIMTGKEDTRVHPSQSMELYRHMKVRTDTPVRLVLYPGEGHGNRNATARLDYSLRQLRWFEKYLKDKTVELDQTVHVDVLE